MPFHHVTAGLLYKGNYLSRSLSEHSNSEELANISVEELDGERWWHRHNTYTQLFCTIYVAVCVITCLCCDLYRTEEEINNYFIVSSSSMVTDCVMRYYDDNGKDSRCYIGPFLRCLSSKQIWVSGPILSYIISVIFLLVSLRFEKVQASVQASSCIRSFNFLSVHP